MTLTKTILFSEIEKLVRTINFENILPDYKITMQRLVDYIQMKSNNNQEIRLTLICTHNSKRNHLLQVLAQSAASYYAIKNVFHYSGETDTAEMLPAVIKISAKQGFQLKTNAEGNNPFFTIKNSKNAAPIIWFPFK